MASPEWRRILLLAGDRPSPFHAWNIFSILTVCADHFELTAARFASLFANCIGKRLESICIGGGSLEERRIGRHSLNHAFIHSVAHSIIHPPHPTPPHALPFKFCNCFVCQFDISASSPAIFQARKLRKPRNPFEPLL